MRKPREEIEALKLDTNDKRVIEHRCWLIMKAIIPGNLRAAISKIEGWGWSIEEAAEYLGGKSWLGRQVALYGLRYWRRVINDNSRGS